MPCVEAFYRQAIGWLGRTARPEKRIDLAHVGAIREIEGFHNKIKLAVLADSPILEDP